MTTISDSAPAFAPTDEDKAAVAGVPARIVAAWARHDADAFAAVFTEDGTMIMPDVFARGRDQVRDFMAAGFAGPYQGTQVTGTPIGVKFLGPDAAVLLTTGGVLQQGETEVGDAQRIRASWLVVRRGAEWLLTAYQNSPAPTKP